MTPERLETIRVNDRVDMPTFAHQHRRELLAYVDELRRELDEITDLDRTALKTQELRDERHRAVAMWHDEKKRAEKAEADRDQARQIAREITRGATRLHDTLRITHQATAALINPEHHTPDRIRRHLAERGWTHIRDTAIGTDWTHGNPVTHWASVPNATHYVDYARRIAEIVGDLADVHRTGELRVLADIEGIDGEPLPDWLTENGAHA